MSKQSNIKYTQKQMEDVFNDVMSGQHIAAAAKKHNIPWMMPSKVKSDNSYDLWQN